VATHQFKFVVSDVELTSRQVEQIGRQVAQAGALALADLVPEHAVTLQVRPGIWWQGKPAVEIIKQLEQHAAQQTAG
jgi:hypothetical protein